MFAHMPSSKSLKRVHEEPSHSKDGRNISLGDYINDNTNKKSKEDYIGSTKKLNENVDNSDINTEHILIIQQLKDNILELSQKVDVKKQIIFEKDKKAFECSLNFTF